MPENKAYLKKVEKQEREWRGQVLEKRIARFNLSKSPTRFYSPVAIRDFDFLDKVGFPGRYPYTAGNNPFDFWRAYAEDAAKTGYRPDWGGAGGGGQIRRVRHCRGLPGLSRAHACHGPDRGPEHGL